MSKENAFAIVVIVLLTASMMVPVSFDPALQSEPEGTTSGPLAVGSYRGFPDTDPDNGKFLGAAGNELSTLAGQTNKLYIGIPAGRTNFTIGVFDGDGDDNWDQWVTSVDVLDFRLYKDPLKSGALTLMDSWDSTSLADDNWTHMNYNTSSDAKAPSGNFFYRIEINWHDPSTANDINGYKIKVDGQISVVRNQPFCVQGAPIGGLDPAPLGTDPHPGDINDPGVNSYNGNWNFYFYVPSKVGTMWFQDGDLDRVDDTDDPNTPNTDPDGSGPAIAEGVNPGNPPDDWPSPVIYSVWPSIRYTITSPTGSVFANNNPSGDREWENFIISNDSSVSPDYLTTAPQQPGLWNLNMVGLDAHNLACLSVPYETFTYDEPPLPVSPPPLVEPDRTVTITMPPAQTVSFAHDVINMGAAQVFDLTAESAHAWVTRIYHDTNGNGVLDAGEPRVNDTGLLGQNATFKIIVQVDVPLLTVGTTDITTVRASSQLEWAVQGTAKDTIIVITNRPPVADPGGPYVGNENSAITFDGSASSDPDGDALTYRWDFENDGVWDTPWSPSPYATKTWGDDYVGDVALEVSDGSLTDMATTSLTVSNVLSSGSIAISFKPQKEGSPIEFAARVTDPGSDDLFLTWSWGDGTPDEYSTYYNNGVSPDPYPSPDINPMDISDMKSHVYGDNGPVDVTVYVRDDDSGSTSSVLKVTVQPENVPPTVDVTGVMTIDEGQTVTLTATATDPGSDDLTFEWTFELGATKTKIYYNNGVSPDPFPSHDGTYPFTATNTVSQGYGDDGTYRVSLLVTDDDGGSTMWTGVIVVNNLPPSIPPFGPFVINEADPLAISVTATDPGSDDLVFAWILEYGPAFRRMHYNDGIGPDPLKSPGGTYPFIVTDTVTHTYGDNGVFTVRLLVLDDDGASVEHETTVTVLNVEPTLVGEVRAYVTGDLTLRVAGEKFHDVVLTLREGDTIVGLASILRVPGSPDDQSVTIHDVTIDLRKSVMTATVEYTPLDDAINGQIWGADPAWLTFTAKDGSSRRIHHTFNVRHEETWIWDVGSLAQFIVGMDITFEATASDPGSDDLTFTWAWGDGSADTTTIYYNDGSSPDPYPSPEVNPISVMNEILHAFGSAGTYNIVLTVFDDDGGSISLSFSITIG